MLSSAAHISELELNKVNLLPVIVVFAVWYIQGRILLYVNYEKLNAL